MGWISVDKRLPPFIKGADYTKTVICFVDGKLMLGQRHYINGEGWLWACGVSYGWGDLNHAEVEADDDYNVTHWMPLPSNPKTVATQRQDNEANVKETP